MKMSINQNNLYENWLSKIACFLSTKQLESIKPSLELTKSYHRQEIEIALESSYLMAKLGYDENAVISALLMYIPNSLRKNVTDPIVLKMISGISAMSNIDKQSNKSTKNRIQLNNINKMIITVINDPRVLVIKLVEQLCKINLINESLGKMEIAKLIMDVYAPLSNKLGIGKLKSDLEDSAFEILNTEQYKLISKSVKDHKNERNKQLSMVIEQIKTIFNKSLNIDFKIYGRAKHIYSIYKKMQKKNVSLEQIYDSIAIRILVPNIDNCYEALSIINTMWENIPDEFDDYIVNPKSNGYRSLHTAVFNNKHKFEVQIRTFQMHQEAEYGIAAHWIYKSAEKSHGSDEQKIKWLRNVLEWGDDLSYSNLHNTDLSSNRVYVFTPMGDVIDLPVGSTPIDFAYSIHTEIGHRCKGAKLSDKIVPLNYKLQTGDQLKILTSNSSNPSRDWLLSSNKYIRTKKAKLKITQWFNQHDIDMLKQLGKIRFDKTVKKLCLKNVSIDNIAQSLNFDKADDFLISIGRGEIKLNSILQPETNNVSTPLIKKTTSKDASDNFYIQGIGVVMSKTAKCCSPNKNDNIIGYISQSKGILIHKVDCNNILTKQGEQINKLIHVKCGDQNIANDFYYVSILADSTDTIIEEIKNLCMKYKFEIVSFLDSKIDKSKILINICITCKNTSRKNLEFIKEKLSNHNNIITLNSNF
ncbi:MAG: bifunctional (p)ppGpp synthetase/guanosine-3',5'-bis(diphosphate) 3'-pyrophosphohydrolase [Legionellales bacterium]|nr:bifunctional (p)ppGpp synthetase/guanosine-3',5'-bis(diphosphate) 3'-pyrophosphohydrolase [Legionellales bacterium]